MKHSSLVVSGKNQFGCPYLSFIRILSQYCCRSQGERPSSLPVTLFLKIQSSSPASTVDSHSASQVAPIQTRCENIIDLSQMSSQSRLLPIARYSLVICRNHAGKFLCVHQRDKSWWISGGGVNPNETHEDAARRETQEETGIKVALKGILSLDQMDFGTICFRVIYYAEPLDQHATPKELPDKQSLGASFLTLEEILQLSTQWRAPEIYNYPKYLQDGGEIFPLSTFQEAL